MFRLLPVLKRRDFLKSAAAATAAAVVAPYASAFAADDAHKPVRVGFVGTGNRGTSLLGVLLTFKGVDVPAVCDIDQANAERAGKLIEKRGQKMPELYTKGDEDFRRLMARGDLDAVIIATPWHWHTPMAVEAMKQGKYTGVEVPCAITLDECWELVKTHEATGVPCMMLENWSFRRDNLAVLNMIRAGLLGEIVHCHCAHSHNCVFWYFDEQGRPRWGGEYLLRRNADQYPTHGLGPVLSWMDINCGDRFVKLVSMSSRTLGLTDQLERKFGKDHPAVKLPYKQGDIVTTMIKTAKGNTVVIAMDMQLPRPYDNRWQIQGTRGIYNEQRDAVYIEGVSPNHDQWEPFAPYQEKYDHLYWKDMAARKKSGDQLGGGHGGTDAIELFEFVRAVRAKTQTPIDVYDSVAMSAVVALTEKSIAADSQPVEFPDFTSGRWQTTAPKFALERS